MSRTIQYLVVTFLILYISDGMLSTIDELWTFTIGNNYDLMNLRMGFAILIILLSLPYGIAIFFSGVSKKFFWLLPIFITPISALLGNWLTLIALEKASPQQIFAIFIDRNILYNVAPQVFYGSIILMLIQFAVGTYFLGIFWHNEFHKTITYQPIRASWLSRILGGILIPLICIISFLGIPILGIPAFAKAATRNYIRFTNSGTIVSREKLFKLTKKSGTITVKVIPMIHIGKKEFYAAIIQRIDYKIKTLFLLEGVSDKNNLVKSFDYKETAQQLGVATQAEHFNVARTVHDKKLNKKLNKKDIKIIIADIDTSNMNPKTIKFLNEMSETFSLQNLMLEDFQMKDQSHLATDIFHKRHARMMELFDKHYAEYQMIIIPWGGLHAPTIEADLIARGFVPTTDYVERVVYNFY
ncbi:hypothetical protein TI05_09275 [Achromatium sp. WMS3]|nr:hypothetical protein TI05_09275 [Achromatium sp. WMS3]